MYFSAQEKTSVAKAFTSAQNALERYFILPSAAWKDHRYEVKTLSKLETHEVNSDVFAHLCKYQYLKGELSPAEGFHFYRVCLQDNRILDAVKRGNSFIKFAPLMLYIAVHELVHVLRFNTGLCDFNLPPDKRMGEEERVHDLTKHILKPLATHELKLVIDCFGSEYLLHDASN